MFSHFVCPDHTNITYSQTMKKKIIIILIIILTLGACSWLDDLFKSKEAIPVTVKNVKLVEKIEEIITPATFKPGRRAEVILSESATLDRIYVDEGDIVTKDQPIFKLEDEQILLKLGQLRASLREADAEMDKLDYFYQNRDRLLDENEIDNDRYDSLENERQEKNAEIDGIKLQIQEFDDRRSKVLHRSPMDGTVETIISIPPGSALPTNKPIIAIAETNPMTAVLYLSADESAVVKPGTHVTLTLLALAGEEFNGSIKTIAHEPDSITGRYETKCIVKNRNGIIKSGMTAEAHIMSGRKRRFVSIPKDALLNDGRRHFVFIIDKDIAHKKYVRLHRDLGKRVEISSGLSDGHLVIVKGNDKLKEGAVVEVWGKR